MNADLAILYHLEPTGETVFGHECCALLLLILAISFALVIFANVKLFHSETLTGMIAIFSVLVTVTLVVVSLIFYKYSH